ncbi:MAG: hypothetical protein K2O45_17190 [Oscillospiraceae bacterium]|nr:hypothetical protein [Oscillospiraceae bacterium]
MVGAISGVSSYYNISGVFQRTSQATGAQSGENARAVQGGGTASLWTARRAASPETPVQPVSPVRPVDGQEAQPVRLGPVIRQGADPAEMAVRMRIKPYEDGTLQNPEKSGEGNDAGGELKVGAEGAQAAVEEGKCQTCEKRKYQDGSDDMGVSFQTPTRIAPEQAAAAVRGHENEHVVREQAKARQEDRRVVSQSVTLHTDICPECGKAYISGGTTRTVTAANPEQQAEDQTRQEQEQMGLDIFA